MQAERTMEEKREEKKKGARGGFLIVYIVFGRNRRSTFSQKINLFRLPTWEGAKTSKITHLTLYLPKVACSSGSAQQSWHFLKKKNREPPEDVDLRA